MKRLIIAVVVLIVSAAVFVPLLEFLGALLPSHGPREPLFWLTMLGVAWGGALVVSRVGSPGWGWPVALFWIASLAVQLLAALIEGLRTTGP